MNETFTFVELHNSNPVNESNFEIIYAFLSDTKTYTAFSQSMQSIQF